MGKKGRKNVVYSTNPDYEYEYDSEEEKETLEPAEQLLYVSIDRKARKGKEVTMIEGFIGASNDLNSLAKQLKSSCGVGGTVKDECILIQGNHRDKIMGLLDKYGYQTKRKGG